MPLPPTQREVRGFLRQAAAARLDYVPTPGAGRLARLSGAVGGNAIIMSQAVTHLNVYQPLVVYPRHGPQVPQPRPE